MKVAKKFSSSILASIDKSKILRIRAGTEHRFTGIWVVVLKDRVFVRPWNNKSSGWYQAFHQDPLGAIQILDHEIHIRARKSRGERLFDKIDQAYAEKYRTPANRKYVRGFALPKRRMMTLELIRD
jgi:hypothetical protein